MSTQHNASSSPLPNGSSLRIAIVAAQWHKTIVDVLVESAQQTLLNCNVAQENIHLYECPGTYEIPVVVSTLARSGDADAIITLGVVIRGETAHFEYVASPVAHALQHIAVDTLVPCVFGVLTTENEAQAWDRAGGNHGNKGSESAVVAVTTALLQTSIKRNA